MYCGYKHVETGPNCSRELATFLKYHMPLVNCNFAKNKITVLRAQ